VPRLAVLLVALVLPFALVACGSGEERDTAPEEVQGSLPEAEVPAEGDAEAGGEIFAAQGCGGCHVFEAAGSSGTTGPNLDDAQPGFEDAYLQVQNGGGGMPAYGDKLSEEEIANVAAYVSNSRR
jgi:mono/diheme cytochrome c family protein